MKKILLTDCSPDVTQLVATLVGDDEVLESEIFQDGRSLDEFKMIFLELGNDKELDAVKVKRLRYACNFRNVPIILQAQSRSFSRPDLLDGRQYRGALIG